MDKILKRLQAIFDGKEPDVEVFDALLAAMPKEKQEKQLYELGQLAFGYYRKLPHAYQKFFRYSILCQIIHISIPVMGIILTDELLCEMPHPWLMLKMFHFLETAGREGRKNYLHLAAAIAIAFVIPEKVRPLSKLSKYLRLVKVLPEEFLRLIGKMEIGDDDYQ